jgi:hypothetical protein
VESLGTKGSKPYVLRWHNWLVVIYRASYTWPAFQVQLAICTVFTLRMFPEFARLELQKNEVAGWRDRHEVCACLMVDGGCECVSNVGESSNVSKLISFYSQDCWWLLLVLLVDTTETAVYILHKIGSEILLSMTSLWRIFGILLVTWTYIWLPMYFSVHATYPLNAMQCWHSRPHPVLQKVFFLACTLSLPSQNLHLL